MNEIKTNSEIFKNPYLSKVNEESQKQQVQDTQKANQLKVKLMQNR